MDFPEVKQLPKGSWWALAQASLWLLAMPWQYALAGLRLVLLLPQVVPLAMACVLE
jgi:hypothetical protein